MVPPLTPPTGKIANGFQIPTAPQPASIKVQAPKTSPNDAVVKTLANAFRGVGQFVDVMA
jgi:hypothetical protein